MIYVVKSSIVKYSQNFFLPHCFSDFCWAISAAQLIQAIVSFHNNQRANMFSPQCIIDGLAFHVDGILWQPLIDPSKPDTSNPETPERKHYVRSTFLALKFIQTRGIAWDVDYPYLGYYDETRKFEFPSVSTNY